jgi:redox-sensitive bicupin YhaK (pirin superfamily)
MARAAQAIEQGCDEDQQRRQAEGGDEMAYFGRDRQSLMLSLVPGARAILIGGEPLEDEILMWWNFVGYSKAEIAEA